MKAKSQKGSRSRKRKTKFRPWLLLFRIILLFCCAFIGWCGYLMWLINGYEAKEPLPHAEAGIVLGAALWNNAPSPALKERLDYAQQLYEAGTVDMLILSGGLGGIASTKTEAEGMRDYLIGRGVPADKLLLENHATSTYQNLLFSQQIAAEHNLSSFIIVTHDYHAARAAEIANYLNIEPYEVGAMESRVLNKFYNETRELLALTKWKLDWLTLVLGLRSPESML